MVLLEGSWAVIQLILEFLIYIAIIINLVFQKGMHRLLFLIVIGGYFIIQFYSHDFFLASTLINMWFVLNGVPFFVSREMLLVLLIVMLFLSYTNPFFYFIAIMIHIINIVNFLFSSFRMVHLENLS